MMRSLSNITGGRERTDEQDIMCNVNDKRVFEQELRNKPLLCVDEIRQYLGLAKNMAYDLVNHNPPFKVTVIGKRKFIHSQSFFNWLDKSA